MCNPVILIHKICSKIFSMRKCVSDAIVVGVLLACMTMTWKRFLNRRLFPRGIHRSPYSPHNEPEMQSFDLSFAMSLDKLLNE